MSLKCLIYKHKFVPSSWMHESGKGRNITLNICQRKGCDRWEVVDLKKGKTIGVLSGFGFEDVLVFLLTTGMAIALLTPYIKLAFLHFFKQ